MAQDLKMAIAAEYAKCAKDPIYTFKKYSKIQHPTRGKILFELYPFQESTLTQLFKNRFTVINKSRQMGISTLVAAYALYNMMFTPGFIVIVICTNQETSKNLVKKVQLMHENFPVWLRKQVVSNNKTSLEFANGSLIKAISSSGNSARSEACSLLIIDEMAFIEEIAAIKIAAECTLAEGGGAIYLSTPCVVGDTKIKIRNKLSGEIREIDIKELFANSFK